jgi:predicted PurR-regulated permease PerM
MLGFISNFGMVGLVVALPVIGWVSDWVSDR